MWKNSLKLKSEEFPKTELKSVAGSVPEKLEGRLFRNGVGVLGRGEQVIQHWFKGNGAILAIEFANGKCFAQYRHIPTPQYVEEEKQNKLKLFSFPSVLQEMMKGIPQDVNSGNPANTSVYPVPNSNVLYALCEGGDPYKISKDTLKFQGYDNLGYLKHNYSAHPKIDPVTGDVYNFGFRMNTVGVYRSSSDLTKLLASTTFELRGHQSIHDCVLAGKYMLIYEYPLLFDKQQMMVEGSTAFDCMRWAPDKLNTLIRVFDKETLSLVATIEAPPLFLYHFVNGYCNGDDEIVVEYCVYPNESVADLMNFLRDVPKMAIDKTTFGKYQFTSYFEEMKIHLPTQKVSTSRNNEYIVEFPVVSDRLVGKEWRYSYAAAREHSNQTDTYFNSVCRYDRESKKADVRKFGLDTALVEPVLIEHETGNYLLTIVYHSATDKSVVYLLNAETLQDIYTAELPKVVPLSFHGKWDSDKIVA